MSSEEYISVIRITSRGGCGCSGVVSSCHIFKADTEELLQKHLKETLFGWLWGEADKEMTKEEFEDYKKDEERVFDLVDGIENTVNIETHSEQWENLNSYCEFTQMEEFFDETVSYEDSLSPAQKAARTKKAIKEGKNPVMVHAGHKAALTRRQNARS